jgi:uncharacterized Ntn-hydrolase superfamily protein
MELKMFIQAAKDFEAGFLPFDSFLFQIGKFSEKLATAGALLAGERSEKGSKNEDSAIDYSEEAIPERDPSYRLQDDTLYKAQTVEVIPAEVRLELARALEQLGMSSARAAMVASL